MLVMGLDTSTTRQTEKGTDFTEYPNIKISGDLKHQRSVPETQISLGPC